MIALCYFAYMVFNKYLSTGQLTTVTKVPTAIVYIIVPIAFAWARIHTIVDVVASFKELNKPKRRGEIMVAVLLLCCFCCPSYSGCADCADVWLPESPAQS